MGALLEDIQDRLQLIQEALDTLIGVPAEIRELKEQMTRSNERHDLAELVIKDQSKTLNSHTAQLAQLTIT